MVHCPKCWTKNEEDAKYCTKCGAALEGSRSARALDSVDEWGEDIGKRAEKWGKQFGKRTEDECFGLPHGGAIIGLFIGAIIILWGLSSLFSWNIEIGNFAIIAIGLLIVVGAIYSLTRKKR